MLPALTDDELFDEVMVAPRDAYVAMPDLRVIARPGWHQLVTPSFARGGLNTVALAVLDPDDADRVIDETIAGYRAAGSAFRWRVDRQSAPADLGARLTARGLVARAVVGMARATAHDEALGPPRSPGLTVERVDRASEPIYTAVMAAGWGVDLAILARGHRQALAAPDGRHRLYLARIDGEPAAVAATTMLARSAYLLGGVVLPAFRGAGLYRALVAVRLDDAAAAGRPLATCQARAETAAPLLARLGFAEVTRFVSYEG